MKISVVIVNWNQRELLLEAVASCYASDWDDLSVIVVDNCSGDDSVAAVRREFPETIILANDSNIGFARGSNQGFERAVAENADYVLFLNSDATLARDAIRALAGLLEREPEAGAVTPYIFYHDRRDLIWYGGGIVRLWRGRIAHRHLRRKFVQGQHQPAITDYLTGCALMIRADLFATLGGFDSTLCMYSEDVDLSLKLRRTGRQLWVTPEAAAYHRISASAGGSFSPFKAFHRGRSVVLLFRRYARPTDWVTAVPCGLPGIAAVSAKLIFTGRLKTVSALWRGIISGFFSGAIPEEFKPFGWVNGD